MQPMTIPEITAAVDGTWLNPRTEAAARHRCVHRQPEDCPGLPVPALGGGAVRRP